MEITPEYLRELLDYDSITGRFTWKARKLRPRVERIDKAWNTRFAGKIVAERRHRRGHLQIGIHCKNYMAHRVAWAIYYGVWPDSDLDHKNGKPAENWIDNLRPATESENLCNSKLRVDNTSGHKGVSWLPGEKKWQVYITKDKKTRHLGRVDSLEEAISIRRAAEAQLHGEFARSA